MKILNTKVARIAGIWILALGAFSTTAVQAHNSLKESTPADGAVLHEAPATLSLTFTESTYLEKVEVKNVNGMNVLSDFSPFNESGTTFNIDLPSNIDDGDYTVHWMVVGDDTHEIKGDFSFKVNSMADEHVGMNLEKSENHSEHGDH